MIENDIWKQSQVVDGAADEFEENEIHEDQVANVSNDVENDFAVIQKFFYYRNAKENVDNTISHLTCRRVTERR